MNYKKRSEEEQDYLIWGPKCECGHYKFSHEIWCFGLKRKCNRCYCPGYKQVRRN